MVRSLPERPRLIMVTSLMTYWYPGLFETIARLKLHFPDVPLWLGGIYARLCTEHAVRYAGVEKVVTDPLSHLPLRIEAEGGIRLDRGRERWRTFRRFPRPLWECYERRSYGVVLTSLGCPFRCPYCASSFLQPQVEQRRWEDVYEEVLFHYDQGIRDIAFYDDALLLYGWEDILKPVLWQVVRAGLTIRFHVPNALHIRAIDEEKSDLLYAAGFSTIRLGLETTDHTRRDLWGGKTTYYDFVRAARVLFRSGFKPSQVGAYLLCGVPGQRAREVYRSIDRVRDEGVLPFLAEYSPIPHTPMWEDACRSSSFDLRREPLYHNNSFFPCRSASFSYDDLVALKRYARRARSLLTSTSIAADSS